MNLRHPLIAALHGQVSSRDHHSRRGTTHHCEHQEGEIVKRLPGFDLEQDADVGTAKSLQMRLERFHVAGRAHEGHANDVGLLGDHLEIFEVFRRERSNTQFAVR